MLYPAELKAHIRYFTYQYEVFVERVKGIEPSQPAWKAGALPLSYTRKFGGDERIRTTESIANGFTVRPIWPTLEHPHDY